MQKYVGDTVKDDDAVIDRLLAAVIGSVTGLIQVSTVTAVAILVDDNLASNSGTVDSDDSRR